MAGCVAGHGIDLPLSVFRKGEKGKRRRGDFDFSPLLLFSPSPFLTLKLLPHSTSVSATLELEACYV
jgi:hypothetical protein